MYIKNIKLNNFRNYDDESIILQSGINVFYGDNAQGKTNILESIYISSMGKSFRTKKDKELIKLGKDNSIIEVEYEKIDREGKLKIDISDKKNIFLNGVKLKKLSEILGKINIVMFSPDDINILKTGPSARRKFLDIMISQLRPAYVYNLNLFLKTLEQRNSYLRQIKYENKSKDMLYIWNEKLAFHAEKVFEFRKEYIEKIKNNINNIHSKITNENEFIKIKYISDCKSKEEYLLELEKNENLDIQKGYTCKGIHRDDFLVFINDKQVNIYGSQGQHRTVILSLKFCELEIVHDEIGEYPILLLDDFMSELDKKRRNNVLENIEGAQVLITCTDKLELNNVQEFNVVNGKLKKEDM